MKVIQNVSVLFVLENYIEWKLLTLTFFFPGVCRLTRHPVLGDECEERDECRAGLHDDGS